MPVQKLPGIMPWTVCQSQHDCKLKTTAALLHETSITIAAETCFVVIVVENHDGELTSNSSTPGLTQAAKCRFVDDDLR